MTVLTCCRLFDLLLDQTKDVVDVADKDFSVDDGCHAPYAQEALPTVLVSWLSDIIDDASDGVLKQVLVTREDVLYVFIHDRH